MPDKIFYSWQSDRPNPTTRRFIEDALKKAIRNLGKPDDDSTRLAATFASQNTETTLDSVATDQPVERPSTTM